MGKSNLNYQLGLYEKAMPNTLNWEEKLINVKKFGFDYLEISIDETDEKLSRLEMSMGERQELLNLMFKHNTKILSMCLSGHRKYPLGSKQIETQKKSLEIMEKAIDFASDLGVRFIQLAGYDEYYNESDVETKSNFEKNLSKCVTMAASKGVLMGFETMETPFMNTIGKSMKYVKTENSKYLGVYPDIGNVTNACLTEGLSLSEDFRKGKGHVIAAHLKETKPGVFREVPFGKGHTDFDLCIRLLKELDVRMFVGEFWYTGSPAWQKECMYASDFLRSKIDKVFSE